MLKSPKVFQFFVIHCCLFTCHICILFSVSSLPNAFYFVVLVVKMPEMAHDWWNKIILFYSILFYSPYFRCGTGSQRITATLIGHFTIGLSNQNIDDKAAALSHFQKNNRYGFLTKNVKRQRLIVSKDTLLHSDNKMTSQVSIFITSYV